MHCLAIMISKYYINLFILLMDFILFRKLQPIYFFLFWKSIYLYKSNALSQTYSEQSCTMLEFAKAKTTQTIISHFLLTIYNIYIDTWKSYYICRCFGCITKSLKWFRTLVWSLPPISSFWLCVRRTDAQYKSASFEVYS